MNEEDVKKVLEIILKYLEHKEFTWRLEGSANLKIQGVDVSIRDLDITTNEEGIEIFRRVLKDYIVKDFFSEKIKGHSLVLDINGFEVEINYYGDRELNMFDKTEFFNWNNLRIPILPLKYAKFFYESIGRKEKVDLISRFLLVKNNS
ncbi:hypothetical protein KY334_00400 [Candidatus Woesearchaeota archaeon]|nr:hypothetical protein [Candidatus Woesearchaeota archaeon]